MGLEEQAGQRNVPMARISGALFLAGFATFSLVYCTQPLLPEFSAEFGVDPATSSLSLSLTTGCLAFSILFAGALSEMLGRRGLMFASICCTALLNLVAAVAPNWETLLIARALEGIAVGGVPAVAMVYLAEETPPWRLGLAMGLYVAGNAFGGMAGRVAMGVLTEHYSWRVAMVSVSLVGLVSAIGFFLLLPPSRNFTPRRDLTVADHFRAWKNHLCDPALLLLFATPFIGVGIFVTIYNYIGFRLLAPPLNLSHAQVGLIFLSYIFGMLASSVAGGMADKIGRPPVMIAGVVIMLAGLALTISSSLFAIVLGVIGVTFGFFAMHSVASSWVGRLARKNKSHASSLYLLAYYTGSSILGSVGGWFWLAGGWLAVAGYCGLMALMILAIVARLRRLASDG